MVLFLLVVLIIISISWLKYYISVLALSYYIQVKQYTAPSNAEMKVCTEYVVKKLFKIS